MYSFKLIYFIIILYNIHGTNCLISDKRLCINEDCSEPVSLARTLLRYNSPEYLLLSFDRNTNIKIFSKEAGSRKDLWGAEVNGKRGYVPKELVREVKVYGRPTVVVDTELFQKPKAPVEKSPGENIVPDTVKQPFEILDGTTIHVDPDSISPSNTESPIVSTASNVINSQTPSNPDLKESGDTVDKRKVIKKHLAQAVENAEAYLSDTMVGGVFSSIKNWMTVDESLQRNDDDESDVEDEDDEDEEVTEESGKENSFKVPSGQSDMYFKQEDMVGEKNEEIKTNSNEIKDVPSKQYVSGESLINLEKSKEIIEQEQIKEAVREEKPILETDNKIIQENDIVEAVTEPPYSRDLNKKNTVEAGKIVTRQPLFQQIKEEIPVIATEEVSAKSVIEQSHAEEIKTKPAATVNGNLQDIKTEAGILNSNNLAVKQKIVDTIIESPQIAEIKEKLPAVETENPLNVEIKVKSLEVTSENLPELEIKKESLEFTDKNLLDMKIKEKSAEAVPDNSQIEENVTDTVMEKNIETTTSQSFDNDEARPILSLVEVTPNPQELNPQVLSSFSNENSFNNTDNSGLDARLNDTALNGEQISSFQDITADVNNFENVEESSEKLEDMKFKIASLTLGAPNIQYGDFETNTNDDSLEIAENYEKINPETPMDGQIDALKLDDEIVSDNQLGENPDDAGELVNLEIPSDSQISALSLNEGIVSNNQLGENPEDGELVDETVLKQNDDALSGIFPLFGNPDVRKMNVDTPSTPISKSATENIVEDGYCNENNEDNCEILNDNIVPDQPIFLYNSDVFIYLCATSLSCIVFLFIYMLVDKNRREGPLIKQINKLERELLITTRENDLLQEEALLNQIPMEEMNNLKQQTKQNEMTNLNLEEQLLNLQKEIEKNKKTYEEQIDTLEKELETSTEVGMELNRIISEILDPNKGGEKLKENVDQLQKQLSEQKWIINDISNSLKNKEAENSLLHTQLDESRRKIVELQNKLDEFVEQIVKIDKEREQQHSMYQDEITLYQQKISDEMVLKETLTNQIQILSSQLMEAERQAEFKLKEFESLKDSFQTIKIIQNDKHALQSLLDNSSIKAELQQLRIENEIYLIRIREEESLKIANEKKCQTLLEQNQILVKKYDLSDKEKVETAMKLEVLNNYFKKREEELQSEILKYKSIWESKEGEATSTTERMKLIADEIENYKSQNEMLKREIVSQEIELKSQISMLERKVHDNWVSSRQMERKLEDARQESAQLRNRLTLRERAMMDERTQNRLQSPLDQNGELALSPAPIESPASPSILFGVRDHITTSPPLAGLPPFLPPPPGAPFIPPPMHGMPPFMPPPPSLFPIDHRPPPLGRMSSPPPPLNSRYTPDNSTFSPFERNSPSPPYDSEYGASPPPIRRYSPYSRDERRDYNRPMHLSNGRNNKGSVLSSGSEHSNDSLDKATRNHSKMV